MFLPAPLKGDSLPSKTLCLTYDDGPGRTEGPGPGPRTLKIAQFLESRGIQAAFFLAGKHVEQFLDLLPGIQLCGHLLANHTYHHANLVDLLAVGGDVVDQITRTDALIRNYIDGRTAYFRSPYGAWTPEVAKALNGNCITSMGYIGPINWDIDGGDWAYWGADRTPEVCANSYLNEIEEIGRGIVLMHDSTADIDVIRKKNMTYKLTEILIPELVTRGYQFIRLDSVPEVASAVRVPLVFALQASNGKYVSSQDGGGGQIWVKSPAVTAWELTCMEYLAPGKVALRAPDGHYFSPREGGGGEVLADGPDVGRWEPLDIIPVGPSRPHQPSDRQASGSWPRRQGER